MTPRRSAGRTPPRRASPSGELQRADPLPGDRCLAGSRWPRPVSSPPGWPAAGYPPTWPDAGSANRCCGRGPWATPRLAGARSPTYLRDLGYGGRRHPGRRAGPADQARARSSTSSGTGPCSGSAGRTGRWPVSPAAPARAGPARAGLPQQPDDRPVPQGQPAVRPVRGAAGAGRGRAAGAGRGPAGRDRGERGRPVRGRLALRHRADPRPGHPARPDLRTCAGPAWSWPSTPTGRAAGPRCGPITCFAA